MRPHCYTDSEYDCGCFLLGLSSECDSTAAVYVSILSNLSHVGDNITVQCRIVGVADIHPRVSWVKSAVGDSDATEQTIADGVHVVEPFSDRYFPSLTPLSRVTLYIVTIYCEFFSNNVCSPLNGCTKKANRGVHTPDSHDATSSFPTDTSSSVPPPCNGAWWYHPLENWKILELKMLVSEFLSILVINIK